MAWCSSRPMPSLWVHLSVRVLLSWVQSPNRFPSWSNVYKFGLRGSQRDRPWTQKYFICIYKLQNVLIWPQKCRYHSKYEKDIDVCVLDIETGKVYKRIFNESIHWKSEKHYWADFSQIIIYELSTPKQLYLLQFSCVISKTAGQYTYMCTM
jgi:hypothetical protein